MPIKYPDVLDLKTAGVPYSWTDREVMLYALGIGMGNDPMDEKELLFVNEGYINKKALKVVPTFAAVCAYGASPGNIDVNRVMVVDGGRDISFHKPLPVAAKVTADSRVAGVFDKGKDKGAVIERETVVRNEAGEPLVTIRGSTFARGDGGFGGPSTGAPEPHPIPERAPDATYETDIIPNQTFIYALSGDRNPLHRDPKIAKLAGFEKPIIHGLCTYGTTCRAIITNVLDHKSETITGYDVRFSSPAYPGENIAVDVWKDGNVVSFRARVPARGVTVINNGKCTLTA